MKIDIERDLKMGRSNNSSARMCDCRIQSLAIFMLRFLPSARRQLAELFARYGVPLVHACMKE